VHTAQGDLQARRLSAVEPGGLPTVTPRRALNSTAYSRMTASDSAGSSVRTSPRHCPSASTAVVAATGGGTSSPRIPAFVSRESGWSA